MATVTRPQSVAYFEHSVTTSPGAALRPGDFTGDASRFGKSAAKARTRQKVARSTEYVGVAQCGYPVKASEHVIPGVNQAHHARGGKFGALVDAVRRGDMRISDIDDPKLARKVALKL